MRIRIIDAFAERPFTGNPAGVCLLDGEHWPPDSWMHGLARELNLPMTAFARPLPPGGEADYGLRWFNAVLEERMCGHATLATTYALHVDRGAPVEVRFATAAGVLPARSDADGTVTLDWPAAALREIDPPAGLAEGLGSEPEAVLHTGALGDRVAVLADEAAVRALRPDFEALARFTRRDDVRGVIATAPAAPGAGHDFVSRFFSPADGLPEDPVTGSAHTALAPYWARRLGRTTLVGLQASQRTGLVSVALRGDRVELSGRAVTVLDGELVATG
jgi:PhzF family phenazine biosynthesis protein